MSEPIFKILKEEQNRIYYFPNNEIVKITGVTHVNVSNSGHHRLNTNDGKKHIVPPGWIHIELDMKEWTF